MQNVKIGTHLGQSLNCDTDGFIWAAADLSQLFGPHGRRQDRPGSILFAHSISRPLTWIFDRFNLGQEFRDVKMNVVPVRTVKGKIKASEWMANYAGFIFLKTLILYLATLFYLRTAGETVKWRIPLRALNAPAAAMGLFVLVNNNTKEFFWSAQTQLFGLFAPMLAAHYFLAIQKTKKPHRMFFAVALICGMGMLFYGIFVIPAVIVGFGYLWRERKALFRNPRATLSLTGYLAAAILMFIGPYALWCAFIVHLNGTFYTYDVQSFEGFVWIKAVIAEQGVKVAGTYLAKEFLFMGEGALGQGWGYLALLLLLAEKVEADHETAQLWIFAGIYSVLVAGFFACYGTTGLRLSFPMVAAFFPVLGRYVERLQRQVKRPERLALITAAGLLCYTVFMLAKFGPYS